MGIGITSKIGSWAGMQTAMVRAGEPGSFNPIYESPSALTAQNRVDELLLTDWHKSGATPARPCSDAVYVRRAFLDVIGTLPTTAETLSFLNNPSPAKRAALIEILLKRDEFADYWTLRWSDTLRIKAEFPINLWPNAAQTYHHWVREQIAANTPYNKFAYALLTTSGSDFYDAPVNFYRAMQNRKPEGIAQTVALTFMGTRSENWKPERLAQMAKFFYCVNYKATWEWKEEIVYFDPARQADPKSNFTPLALPCMATLPDGKKMELDADHDPRLLFATWLTSPGNAWFSRAVVNRVWFWLMGAPLTVNADEIESGGKVTSSPLLDYLASELERADYDLLHIYRLILTSGAYQLSSLPQGDAMMARAQFASYAPRRLDAEVLIDALCQISGTSEDYSSAIPEPYTFMPPGQRAISLPDGSISSAFLEQFGKPARDTGLQNERNNTPTDAQRLYMLNSSHIQKKIQQGPRVQKTVADAKSPDDLVDRLYLMILSRHPSDSERATALAQLKSGSKNDSVTDLAWALVNTTEFLYRH